MHYTKYPPVRARETSGSEVLWAESRAQGLDNISFSSIRRNCGGGDRRSPKIVLEVPPVDRDRRNVRHGSIGYDPNSWPECCVRVQVPLKNHRVEEAVLNVKSVEVR
ncbi:hypothetical protein TNCV_1586551 [Trichonephila clavipes]|nr:hypothetical protein TNCV_1586551 [Trichonephila clavipes]